MKGSTTFTSTFMTTQNLPLPSLLICIPGLKQSAIEKYGYAHVLEVIYDPDERYKWYNKTPKEIVMDQSLNLGQDFDIQIGFFLSNSYELKMGLNEDSHFFVRNIITSSGLCYLIETHLSIQEYTNSTWFYLSLKSKNGSFTDSLSDKSKLSNVQIFITSNNTWQGKSLFLAIF